MRVTMYIKTTKKCNSVLTTQSTNKKLLNYEMTKRLLMPISGCVYNDQLSDSTVM